MMALAAPAIAEPPPPPPMPDMKPPTAVPLQPPAPAPAPADDPAPAGDAAAPAPAPAPPAQPPAPTPAPALPVVPPPAAPEVNAEAENTISGTVVEAATGVPVPEVFISADNITALTDSEGRFTLVGVPSGDIEVVAVADAFEPQVLATRVGAEIAAAALVFALEPAADLQGEVVEIVGDAPDITAPPSYELDVAEIKILPGSGNDILKSLQSLPAVARVPFGFGGLVLRGASPRDSNVFLDGVEVPLLYHFGGLASFYPSSMLDSLDLVPGGFSAEYGRTQGGVVVLRSRPGRSDRWRVESEVSIQDASVHADGPGPGGGSWSVGLRRSYIDTVLAVVVPEDSTFALTQAPRYYDGQVRYDLELGGGQRLSAMLFGSDDRLQFLFEDEDDDTGEMSDTSFRYTQRFARAALRWERRTSDVTLSLTPWVGWDENGVIAGDFRNVRETIPVGARADALRSFAGGYVAGGIDLQGARNEFDINSNQPAMPGMPDTDDGSDDLVLSQGADFYTDIGFWLEGLYGFADDRFSVKPGLRIDHFGLSKEWVLDPRLNLAQVLSDEVTLKQSIGIFHQPPNLPDMAPLFGNPDLGASYALQSSAGVEVKLPQNLEIKATAFFDQTYDQAVDVVSGATGAAAPGSAVSGGGGAAFRELSQEQFGLYAYQENQGRGRNYGLETLVRAAGGMPGRAGQWMGWISYTLSRSLRTYNPNVYGTGYYPYVLDQPHVLTALGSYAITDAWRVGARVRFVSGNPITPVTGSYFDAGSQRYEPESGDVLSTRLPAFFQLDLRVDRTWKRSWGILRLFLDIQNVTNRANPEDIIYNNDYSDFVYARGLPILPVLGLEYRQ